MALNWSVFRTRALTAIVFVVVMLAGLLWNHWSFFILFSVIHFGCWWEYLKLLEKIHQTSFHAYSKLGWMLIGYGIMLWFCGSIYEIAGYGLKDNISLPVSIAGFVLLAMGIFQKQVVKPVAYAAAGIGLLYISVSWGMMMHLRFFPYEFSANIINESEIAKMDSEKLVKLAVYESKGFLLCVMVILTMWINDTMAYVVGSLIGKTPLSKISPKKTWEGTIGGILLAAIIVGLLSHAYIQPLFIKKYSLFFWMSAPLIASITGTIGDLLESKLKRMADVKDSGSIMPGHGGFLDRFDSLLLATPFTWLYVMLFMN